MPATYVQAERPLRVTTPLGKDVLLLVGLSGHEGISQLYSLQLDVLAENKTDVPFDKLLGQKITVDLALPGGNKRRYFNGICNCVAQGMRDFDFTGYRLEIVPQFWLLTKRAQSRTFQHISVPDILKKVLDGLDVTYELQGTFHPRDYCVQYRETDFNFASRLMEEEGIYYFFKHSAGGHQMVVANTPQSHPNLPEQSTLIFEELSGGGRAEDRISEWQKVQELRSGKYTLWDHCFELPYKNLEADKTILDSVQVGKVTHKQRVGGNDKLEIYDYPGEYAQRFDGVDKGGGEQPAELQKIFEDNKRTVGIREQQETMPGLYIQGKSSCRQMVTGHKFTLTRHFNADGQYVLTGLQHNAILHQDYRSGDHTGKYLYQNTFTCIPFAQPYRPVRSTPKPVVQGTQTAVVVGPPGEEIFTDKYGRVKVQFRWDRQGKHDMDSSCWVRVTQPWAGKRWGASFWPRVGQEVIVDFLEGDPDRPIIVGTVYNADQMPPYLGKGPDPKHTHDNKVCGIKSNSTAGGNGFNEWRFDDSSGREQIFIHGERNMDTRVKNDCMERIIHDRHLIVGAEKDGGKSGDQREMVYQDKHLHVHRDHIEHIAGNMELLIGGADGGGDQDIVIKQTKRELIEKDSHVHVKSNRKEKVDLDQTLLLGGTRIEQIKGYEHLHVEKSRSEQVDGTQSLTVGGEMREKIGSNDHRHVKGNRNEKVEGTQSLTVGGDLQEKVGGNHAQEAQEIHLKAGMKVILEAGMQLTIKGPGGFVDIGPAGVTIQGILVKINSGGSAGSGSGCTTTAPEAPAPPKDATQATDAKEAHPKVPAEADDSKSGVMSLPDSWPGPAPGPTGI